MAGPNYKRIHVPHPVTGEKVRLQLHVYVWLVANGYWAKGQAEVPKGHEIHHKDFNPFNNDLSNLQLVTNSEHSAIHWQVDRERKRSQFNARMAALTPEQKKQRARNHGDAMRRFYASTTEEDRKTITAAAIAAHRKLSDDDVREIRRVYATLRGTRTGEIQKLAERFGLKSRQHIRAIVSRRLFPNVE